MHIASYLANVAGSHTDGRGISMDIKQLGQNVTTDIRQARSERQAAGGAEASAEQAQAAKNSRLELSAEAHAVQSILGRLSELPDVDSARVARVKAAIDEGRYQVDAERLAGKLLNKKDESAT